MPKKPPALCMFCNSVPCTCGDSVKQRPARKTKPSPRERSTPPDLHAEVEVPSVAGGVDSVFDEVKTAPKFKVNEAERDLDMEGALLVLLESGLLKESSAKEVREQLSPPLRQDVDRRIADWKARNGMVD